MSFKSIRDEPCFIQSEIEEKIIKLPKDIKMCYVTNCGSEQCLFTNRKQLKKYKGNSYYICPKHGSKVSYRFSRCKICNDWMIIFTHGGVKRICPECEGKHLKWLNKKTYNKNMGYEPPKNTYVKKIWSLDSRGDYCKNLSICKKTNHLNCFKCEDFNPIFKNVDPEKSIYYREK